MHGGGKEILPLKGGKREGNVGMTNAEVQNSGFAMSLQKTGMSRENRR